MENANCFFQNVHERNRRPAIFGIAHNRADDRRINRACRGDHMRQLLLGRPLRCVEEIRKGTHRQHADLNLNPSLCGMRFHSFQVGPFETSQQADLAEMHQTNAALCAVVEYLERRPVLRSQTVGVNSEATRISEEHHLSGPRLEFVAGFGTSGRSRQPLPGSDNPPLPIRAGPDLREWRQQNPKTAVQMAGTKLPSHRRRQTKPRRVMEEAARYRPPRPTESVDLPKWLPILWSRATRFARDIRARMPSRPESLRWLRWHNVPPMSQHPPTRFCGGRLIASTRIPL